MEFFLSQQERPCSKHWPTQSVPVLHKFCSKFYYRITLTLSFLKPLNIVHFQACQCAWKWRILMKIYIERFFFPIAFQFLAQPVKEVKPIMFVWFGEGAKVEEKAWVMSSMFCHVNHSGFCCLKMKHSWCYSKQSILNTPRGRHKWMYLCTSIKHMYYVTSLQQKTLLLLCAEGKIFWNRNLKIVKC